MNKQEKLTQWFKENHCKYLTNEEWRKALIKFVCEDLNFIESTWTSKCFCGKDQPCDGEGHDFKLWWKVRGLELRMTRHTVLFWVVVISVVARFVIELVWN